jgi:murein DD-endopeptidase MepM/ murein hydrolase activator NlpD
MLSWLKSGIRRNLPPFEQWGWQRITAAALLVGVGLGLSWLLAHGQRLGPRVTVEPSLPVMQLAEPQVTAKPAGSATAPETAPGAETDGRDAGLAQEASTPAPAEAQPGTTGPAAPASLSRLRWPIEGRVARGYGYGFVSAYQDYRFHSGIDLAAAAGTPVVAAADGEVKETAYDAEHRWQVVLSHGAGWETVYLELDRLADLTPGEEVRAGSVLGYLGAPGTGADTPVPHLHFEVHRRGEARDPLEFLR